MDRGPSGPPGPDGGAGLGGRHVPSPTSSRPGPSTVPTPRGDTPALAAGPRRDGARPCRARRAPDRRSRLRSRPRGDGASPGARRGSPRPRGRGPRPRGQRAGIADRAPRRGRRVAVLAGAAGGGRHRRRPPGGLRRPPRPQPRGADRRRLQDRPGADRARARRHRGPVPPPGARPTPRRSRRSSARPSSAACSSSPASPRRWNDRSPTCRGRCATCGTGSVRHPPSREPNPSRQPAPRRLPGGHEAVGFRSHDGRPAPGRRAGWRPTVARPRGCPASGPSTASLSTFIRTPP